MSRLGDTTSLSRRHPAENKVLEFGGPTALVFAVLEGSPPWSSFFLPSQWWPCSRSRSSVPCSRLIAAAGPDPSSGHSEPTGPAQTTSPGSTLVPARRQV